MSVELEAAGAAASENSGASTPDGGERSGGGTRRKARQAALELLFEAHLRSVSPVELLDERLAKGAGDKDRVNPDLAYIRPYTAEIVRGVSQHSERIDELLSTYSTHWSLDRMPNVDRELLRIGVWELLYNEDVAEPIAIDEAVALAASLSTDDSPAFVNALLDRIAKLKPMLAE